MAESKYVMVISLLLSVSFIFSSIKWFVQCSVVQYRTLIGDGFTVIFSMLYLLEGFVMSILMRVDRGGVVLLMIYFLCQLEDVVLVDASIVNTCVWLCC